MRILEQFHSAEKRKRRTLWAFSSSSWLQKTEITQEGTLWRYQETLDKSLNAKKQ